MTAATKTETTRNGFDLVMVRECGEWVCSLYRIGGQIPLRRKMVATEAAAEKWFDRMIAKETLDRISSYPTKTGHSRR